MSAPIKLKTHIERTQMKNSHSTRKFIIGQNKIGQNVVVNTLIWLLTNKYKCSYTTEMIAD